MRRRAGIALGGGGAGIADIDDGPVILGFIGGLEAGDVVKDLVEIFQVDDGIEACFTEHDALGVVRFGDAVGSKHDALAGGEPVLDGGIGSTGDEADDEVAVFKVAGA